ncbi:DUF4393 domain-containing protein [Providencia rettgeri]|uniref:DUF4393 domain-containing protein n=2 Tax=Providencia rettgeri TaxID=587 RepID=UPI001B37DD3B|nr:DUF4393 domain-containing protein [Providencia rettgeri]MBQ0326122.1 DUF4393 domain-containing protein [Providencia rettgeri]
MLNNKEDDVSMKKTVTDAAVEMVKSIPIDDNAKKIVGKEVGKTLTTITKAVNLVISPLAATVYGYETIKDFLVNTLSEKLKKVPLEDIVEPKARVVGAALESLKHLDESDDDAILKDMYANLIASSINRNVKQKAHPAFVEIIKQLDPFDVKLLEYLRVNAKAINSGNPMLTLRQYLNKDSGVQVTICKWLLPDNALKIFDMDLKKLESSIENLERLKLIFIESNRTYTNKSIYEELFNGLFYKSLRIKFGNDLDVEQGYIEITSFGDNFLTVCS